jgi:hypothetical protein
MNALSKRILALAFLVSFATALASAQATAAGERRISPLNSLEIAGGITGIFTSDVQTNSSLAGSNSSTVPESATKAFGGLATIQDRPTIWAGVELNYGFSELSEKFQTTPGFRVKTAMNEATGAVVFHPRLFHLQPFVALGGGYIVFVPVEGTSQWRGTGLGELGFDVPTGSPHIGFRVQVRALVHQNPNFYITTVGTADWVATTEPMVGAWYRW